MKTHIPLLLLCMTVASSCAVLKLGTTITSAFMQEDDPELAAAALPTMIKASEALYMTKPKKQSNALRTASLYVMYGNAFLETPSFLLPDDEFDKKQELLKRANNLYLKAANILVPVVERQISGFFQLDHPEEKIRNKFNKKDIPLLYWTGGAILSAFASDPMNFDNAARAAGAISLFERALAIDPYYDNGSLQELAVTLYGSLPADLGGDLDKAKHAYQKALEISKGKSPGLFVAYASTICVYEENRSGFLTALETALSLETRTESALLDTLAKQKAARLLSDIALYF